jgi:hypothetical protein
MISQEVSILIIKSWTSKCISPIKETKTIEIAGSRIGEVIKQVVTEIFCGIRKQKCLKNDVSIFI